MPLSNSLINETLEIFFLQLAGGTLVFISKMLDCGRVFPEFSGIFSLVILKIEGYISQFQGFEIIYQKLRVDHVLIFIIVGDVELYCSNAEFFFRSGAPPSHPRQGHFASYTHHKLSRQFDPKITLHGNSYAWLIMVNHIILK